mmetsp:Transcript_10328/g.21848  ORF Transcript_10328/g.21848 Transcript_10328/m.21848 type:complete len:384 (-) Transcript_10328:61-1212(-)
MASQHQTMSSLESSQHQQQSDQQTIVGTDKEKKKWYLLLCNPSKTTHLGTLLRCAAAFQVHQVLLVGYDKFNCQGSFGSHLFLDIVVFPSWDSVHDYLRRGGDDDDDDGGNDASNDCDSECNANEGKHHDADEQEQQNLNTDGMPVKVERKRAKHEVKSLSSAKAPITTIGILGAYGGGEEIFSPDGMAVYQDLDNQYVSLAPPQENAPSLPHCSFPISSRPFSNNVCFLLSKDKRGLPSSQAKMCTGFVHAPHLNFDDDEPAPQIPESNDAISKTPKQALPKSTIAPTPSNLLDTATTLSIVLHHFTAWARYSERTFAENQKFVKDIKPNARRRLCRRVGENEEKKILSGNGGELESNTEQDAMDAMMLWKESEDASKDGDY